MLSQSEITRLLDLANTACHHGYALEARIIVAGVLSAKPEHIPAMLGLVYSHIVVDDFATAEQMLMEQVLPLAPEDADAKALLAFVYFLTQRPDEARALLSPLMQGDNACVSEKTLAMVQELWAALS